MDRMMMRWAGALLLGVMLGCDKPPPPPPPEVEDAAAESSETGDADRRPTMAELMSGPWRTVQLGIHPLRVQVPAAWEVESLRNVAVLRGPTPSGPLPEGNIDITISRPPPFPKEMAKIFEEDQRRAATQPAAAGATPTPTTTPAAPELNAITARVIGASRILDIRASQPAIATEPPTVNWRIIVFIPTGGEMVNIYQLNFVGLPLEQYHKDKELLEKIVGSLEVDASANLGPATPSSPASNDPLR